MYAIGLPASGHFAIGVITSAPIAPSNIVLTRTFCRVNAGANAAVGRLQAVDSDSTSHVFSLVFGDGSTHNSSFNISGNLLRCNSPSALGVGVYSIRIQVDDGETNTYSRAITISILDVLSGAGPGVARGQVTTQTSQDVIQEVIN